MVWFRERKIEMKKGLEREGIKGTNMSKGRREFSDGIIYILILADWIAPFRVWDFSNQELEKTVKEHENSLLRLESTVNRNQRSVEDLREVSKGIKVATYKNTADMAELKAMMTELLKNQKNNNNGGTNSNNHNNGGANFNNHNTSFDHEAGPSHHNNYCNQADGYESRLSRNFNHFTKLDFPQFDGTEVEEWIYKCEHFFAIDETPERLKIQYVVVNLEGKALKWHQSYMKIRQNSGVELTWDEYVRSVTSRFSSVLMEDGMGALKALVQTDSLEEYFEAFDLLLNRVNIIEEYAVSLFIQGLKPEIRCYVKLFKPTTLKDAYHLAKLQTDANITMLNYNSSHKPISSYTPRAPTSFSKGFAPAANTNKLSLLPTPPKVLNPNPVDNDTYVEESTTDPVQDQDPQISLNAITGNPSFSTMKIVGNIGTKPLQILIDSGSTHNFLNDKLATKLQCPVQAVSNMPVTIADGNKLNCMKICKDFQWNMQGNWFKGDMLIIPLSSYDVVLGIQWLQTLNDITWNFKELTMKFTIDQHNFELKVSNPRDSDLLNQHQPTVIGSSDQVALNALLNKFDDVFAIPKGLPPNRPCDHKIRLKDANVNLNLKPYRHPSAQKDVIEQMTQELIDSGVVRNSTNAFVWHQEAQNSFEQLKVVLTNPPVLALQDFSKTFVIETDASARGLGAVLMQDNHPIAFISKGISVKQQAFSVYEKELLAILLAVKHWHQYLITKHFIIKTDQQSLKIFA
ncbi:uncharacterized protein LOC143614842 [Bidens hawaiensis]|uniref:uncharacterized protein LOC143614842 n=1 Tax=Bidens hawaiensis TaxID=980011 RepID=UPI00404B5158